MTTKYAFTIYGNQEDAEGNPIPYFRSTQGSFFNKGSRRYHAWKDYVRKVFMQEARELISSQQYNLLDLTHAKKGKPIEMLNEECQMMINIFWKNNVHGDADNIFKGIADALFLNDKDIWFGSFRALPAGDKKGRVEVSIEIREKHDTAKVGKSKRK